MKKHGSEWQQWRGTVQLAGEGFDEITSRVHEFHRAISDIPFRSLAPIPAVNAGAATTRVVHDTVTDGVYTAVRLVGKAVFQTAAVVMRESEPLVTRRAAVPHRVRDDLVSAASGLVGDHMARSRNPLTPRLGFRHRGAPLPLQRDALAAAYPQARSHVVVFAHGLCCNENSWRLYVREGDEQSRPYGERLEADLEASTLYLRYNSGQRIADNGRALARQLQRLNAQWPVPIERITLIGHSMGGLVVRAAAAEGHARHAPWADKVQQVICLGSPHLGAPLEKLVHAGIPLLHRFSLSRPLARVLDVRSVGIRDLRHGSVHPRDRHALAAGETAELPARIARLPQARYHFIGSTLGGSETDPVSQVIGDGLVLLPSAKAHHLADADTATLFRMSHMRLLNHPLVYAHLLDALQLH
ncbi:hypothetical protein E4T66_12855 [Sinimarinibacterium sp. CAU 1509]|uniref:esterase/lipase family protein n=1 Tax=Sinimarinibacterium sp. CAU 1509 TaxID=2562283 RepID=UPI0010ACB03B|nr:alpha/beta fold hydrolase [Sinimarinibacterium sp. CAU 1509]TJY59285.1 hypothetical protein E4T66_12855 [Sinimarinibacterium sp. CAU 1509]